MNFVIDANILMSILISGKASYKPLLTYYNFILPDFVLVELEKHKEVLKSKTKMTEVDFLKWSYYVFSQITILPNYILSLEGIEKSEKLLKKIDLKDMTYVALAMQLNLPLLTRDKLLYEGLRKQKFKKVILFEEFLQTL